jgi:hypothetical protein
VKATVERLPERSEIVAAFDADGAGRKLVEVVRLAVAAVAAKTGRRSLIFHVYLPALEGEDWNQVLQEHSQRKEKPPVTGVLSGWIMLLQEFRKFPEGVFRGMRNLSVRWGRQTILTWGRSAASRWSASEPQ